MTTPPIPGSEAAPILREPDGTAYMVGGMTVGVVAAYAFQLAGGRVLGTEDFAPVSVMWTLQFLVVTILFVPVEQFTIRELALAGGDSRPLHGAQRTIGGVLLGGTLFAAIIVAATRDQFFTGDWWFAGAALAIFAGFALGALGKGFLGGRRRYRDYGLVLGGEALARLAAAGLILVVAPTSLALTFTLAAGGWVVLVARPFRSNVRSAEPAATARASAGGFLTGMFSGNAASQTLLAAGPLAVGALGADASDISILFVTFTLFRGPLTMSYALLARVLPPLTRLVVEGNYARLRRLAEIVTGLGIIASVTGGLIATWLGPAVIELLFGEEFRPPGSLAGLAAAGVVAGGIAFFVGQTLVAEARTTEYAAIWVSGLSAALIVLLVSTGSALTRVGAAFAIGEGTALAATFLVVRFRDPKVATP